MRRSSKDESNFQSWLSRKLMHKHLADAALTWGLLDPADQEVPYTERKEPKPPRDLRGENPFSDPPYYDENNELITGEEEDEDVDDEPAADEEDDE